VNKAAALLLAAFSPSFFSLCLFFLPGECKHSNREHRYKGKKLQ